MTTLIDIVFIVVGTIAAFGYAGMALAVILHIRRLNRDMSRRQVEPPVVVKMRMGG